jgi:integrase
VKPITTQLAARNAKKGVYRVAVGGVEGLYFKKKSDAPGAGSFFRRFWINGKRRAMGLGPLSQVSLAEAVKRAQKLALDREEGIDPIEQRKRERAANHAAEQAAKLAKEEAEKKPLTFIDMAEKQCVLRSSLWRHRYAVTTWRNPLVRHVYPVIGHLPLNDITVDHVVEIVRSAVAAGKLPTGKRVQTRIGEVMNAALAGGLRDAALGNPADPRKVTMIYPVKRRGARPHFRRIAKLKDAPAAFLVLVHMREGVVGFKALALDAWLLMIACACRPSEALNACWSEFDFEEGVWTIPATRMKSARPHAIPLNAIALAVLKRRWEERRGDAVFPGRSGKPMGYANFARTPIEIDAALDFGSPHSWRSVFRDWAGDVGRLHIDRDLAELALAHVLEDTEGSYRRETGVEARRAPMEAYARWLNDDRKAVAIPLAA